MTILIRNLRFVLAGYGFPAEFALHELFGAGIKPEQVLLLTHPEDARNIGLLSHAKLRSIGSVTDPANRPEVIARVEAHQPDIVISMHYRLRVPPAILAAARLGTVNLHPSLLPLYRGTNSVPWAIINGETETGFTFHTMTEEFDTGRILLQQRIPIEPDETAFSLFNRQIALAMPRLKEVLSKVAAGDPGVEQVGEGTYYPRRPPHDGLIDPTWSDDQVERFIRAMYFPPFPPAQVVLDGVKHDAPTMEAYHRLIGR